MRNRIELYLMWSKVSILAMIQYRFAHFMWLIGMIAEPVIYLVVWSTIAKAQGGR